MTQAGFELGSEILVDPCVPEEPVGFSRDTIKGSLIYLTVGEIPAHLPGGIQIPGFQRAPEDLIDFGTGKASGAFRRAPKNLAR